MVSRPVLERRRTSIPATSDLLLAVLAIFIPPFTVFIKMGFSVDLLLNIVLTMFGAVPGILHAWYILIKYPDDGIPVVSDWISRHSLVAQVGPGDERSGVLGNFGPFSRFTSQSQSGYSHVASDDLEPSNRPHYGDLESGTMPGTLSNDAADHHNQQQQQEFNHNSYYHQQPNVSGPPPAQSSSAGNSSMPPPYNPQQGHPSGFIPGDNKVQYNSNM